MFALATLAVTGERLAEAGVPLTAVSTLTAAAIIEVIAAIQLVTIATLLVAGTRVPSGIPNVAGTGILLALDAEVGWFPVVAL